MAACRTSLAHAALLATAITTLCGPTTASAQPAGTAAVEASHTFDVPADTLDQALIRFGRQAAVSIVVNADVTQGLRSPGVRGRLTVDDGLRQLLAGTGLQALRDAGGEYTLRRLAPAARASTESTLPVVKVTAGPERVGEPAAPYAGGQVATGGPMGLLGDTAVMDAPFNVTHYTNELIRNQQAATIADVLDNDPAVRISSRGRNTSVGGGDNYFIRGFNLAGRDISLNGLYGVLPYGSLSLETVERVEVLKGPGALLNGMAPSGGVGGAIDVTPKRATDAPITQLTTTWASDRQWGGHVDVGRRFGDGNAFGVRVNGVYRDGDTAVSGQSARLVAGAVGLDYRGERLRVSADAGHQGDRVQAASSGFDFDGSLTTIPGAPRADTAFTRSWELRDFKDDYAAVRADYDVSDTLAFYGAAGTRRHAHSNFRTISTIVDADGNLATTPVNYPEASTSRSFLLGGRVRFEALAGRHDLNVAAASTRADARFAYAWWDTVDSNLYRATPIPRPTEATAQPGGFFDLRTAYDRRTTSVGIADTVSWRDDTVRLLVGLRRQEIVQDNFDPWTPGTPFASGYRKAVNTPAVGLTVKPWKNTSLYANYIEGLSPGATAPADAENSGEVFEPARTKQIELGAKVDLGRMLASVAVFELRQPNAVTVPGSAPSTYVYRMDGEQRNRGVEFSTVGEPVPGLRVITGATWLQAKQRRTEGGANDGRDAIAAPRWFGNLGLDWDVPFARGLSLSTRVLATSAQYMDTTNTLQLPGWGRWDLGARYVVDVLERPVTLRANVINVTDRDVWESSGGSAGILVGAPRTWTVSATVAF